jgi:hypothetical protein
VTVRDLTAADAALLARLIEQYPFKPFRHHRFLSRERQIAVMQAEVDRALGIDGRIALVAGEPGAEVVVTGRPLSWDSEFFGIPMGRVDYVLRSAGAGNSVIESALRAALGRFRSAGVRHLALKADVSDHELAFAAEEAGFRLMDAIVTYIAHPRRPPPRPVRPVGNVRPFEPADTESLLEITRAAYRGYRGRFQLDPHLPQEKSDAFYLEWARQCCAGVMADRVYVAEDARGRLMGWASVKRAEPVSSVGGGVISVGSLGACRADAPGAYASLICAAAAENHAAGALTEAMTQNSNYAMVRVLEAVGAQYARAEYTFHAWLG